MYRFSFGNPSANTSLSARPSRNSFRVFHLAFEMESSSTCIQVGGFRPDIRNWRDRLKADRPGRPGRVVQLGSHFPRYKDRRTPLTSWGADDSGCGTWWRNCKTSTHRGCEFAQPCRCAQHNPTCTHGFVTPPHFPLRGKSSRPHPFSYHPQGSIYRTNRSHLRNRPHVSRYATRPHLELLRRLLYYRLVLTANCQRCCISEMISPLRFR